eukprot:gene27291-48847_t
MILAHTIRHHLASLIGGGAQAIRRGLGPGRPSRGQQGFSLLEALVAMSIASIALASLYRTVGQSSKGVVDVESRIEAALVARSALAGSTFAEDIERQPSGATAADPSAGGGWPPCTGGAAARSHGDCRSDAWQGWPDGDDMVHLETLSGRAMSRVFHKRRSGGFTLLELLIALAVTAAVVALMFAGFGTIGRSEERNQRVMERSERMLVVSQWLGRKFDG